MNEKEAIQAMLNGEKVKNTVYDVGRYYEFNPDRPLSDPSRVFEEIIDVCIHCDDKHWEIYKEKKKVNAWEYINEFFGEHATTVVNNTPNGVNKFLELLKTQHPSLEIEIDE
jgi:hypothetical protein